VSTRLVLSLFPGVGLFDQAFEEAGFCVVRGPDLLWGGDIKAFHPPPGRFDGIIGGPPCQRFSRLAALVKHTGGELAEDLIPEFERVVHEGSPSWFVMENVPAAPTPHVPGYEGTSQVINNRWFGGVQNRERRFYFGTVRDGVSYMMAHALHLEEHALERADYAPAVCASGSVWQPSALVGKDGVVRNPRNRRGRVYGDKSTRYLREAIRAQGLPDDFDLPGFTVREKVRAVGNGVPLPLGRAVANAVMRTVKLTDADDAPSAGPRLAKCGRLSDTDLAQLLGAP
jgi:DNA (cytosine-5)-methyltransferase 1